MKEKENNRLIFNLKFLIFNQFLISKFLIILLIIVDQLTKFLVLDLGIVIVKNRGVAFSLLTNINPLLILFALVVLIVVLKKELNCNSLWLWVILAGGLSNFIDRIRLGYVVDFIHIGFLPVFNLADVFIAIGVMGVLYESFAKSYFRRQ